MGKEIYYTAKNAIGYETEFVIKGFLDDNIHSMDGFEGYPPVLGTINDYQPEEDDVFVCSMGNVQSKKKVCEMIKSKGGKFHTVIHKDAQIREQVSIGAGTIVDWNACVGSNVTIGENSLIQMFAIVGHDCKIGNYTRLDTKTVCVGGVIVEDCSTIHTAAVISHNVVVGEGATVAAMSFVIRKVKPGTTVAGNPTKLVEF